MLPRAVFRAGAAPGRAAPLRGLCAPTAEADAKRRLVTFFVRDLPKGTTEDELKEAFAVAGASVSGVKLPACSRGESRGFGFVSIESKECDLVRREVDGSTLRGRRIRVEVRWRCLGCLRGKVGISAPLIWQRLCTASEASAVP
ncbi:hypothetical protein M885DRAFT_493639 [Pelagophyceae sp. CCMP2097]|nr:hypothetical protein M885DRAFT_493639 [Pelagophyceae sp. CCMP2097]